MRKWIWILLLAAPAHGGEMCVQEAPSLCCHPNCDVPHLTTPAGYSEGGVPSCGAFGEFTLSSSATDPYQSQGPLAEPFGHLYLWATAGGGYGFSTLGEVTISGSMPLWEFRPLHPELGWDSSTPPFSTTWTFWTGCLQDPLTLLAEIVVVSSPVPVPAVESRSWARIKALSR